MFREFSHVMLFVNDVSRAIAWYAQTLDFSVRENYAPHYAILWHERLKLRLDLHPDRSGQEVGRGAQVYFQADNLDAAIAALGAKGVSASEPRSEGDGSVRFSSFKDSEGNVLGMWESVKR